MKTTIAAFLLVISVAGLPGIIRAEPANPPRREQDTAVKGTDVAADTATYMRESAKPKEQRVTNEEQKKRFEGIIARIKVMSPGQMKIFADELLKVEDVRKPVTPAMFVDIAVKTIVLDRPEDALEVCEGLPDAAAKTRQLYIPLALRTIAQEDPAKAVAWLESAERRNPGLFDGKRFGESLVSAIAPQDPKLACQLATKYQVEPMMLGQYLMGRCEATEKRNAALAELRNYAAGLKGKSGRKQAISFGLAAAGRDLSKEGFQAGSSWADQASLTVEERREFCSEIMSEMTPGEEGKWLEWFGATLPEDSCKKSVAAMMSKWTQTDYKAAGEWLNTAPAGVMKNEAIRLYSRELANYEPEAAAGWAVTLPEGETRDQTLHCIYYSWLKKGEDAEPAAEAFAAKYKIKKHEEGEVHEH